MQPALPETASRILKPSGNFALDRQLARWYPLIDHPVQLALIKAVPNGIRFPLVPAGRRSGKTERFKRFLVKRANRLPGMYFAGAPTYGQAKKIFWKDLKDFCLTSILSKKPSESDLIIFLENGSEIHVIGFDNPTRFEGIPWDGGGIDEFGDIKGEAWEANIYPALNTVNPLKPDYRAWAWLLGVPAGLNHYFDLCNDADAGMDPAFCVFHWKSAEILPADVIATLQRTMSEKQFRQEFEASFETATGRIYENYSKANHTDATIQPHEQLLWMHDQNFTPLSSAIGVRRHKPNEPKNKPGNDLYLLDEIVLSSAVSRQSAIEFVEKFKHHQNRTVLLYGDPAGKAGEKHGHGSDYTEIEGVLKQNGWTVIRRIKKAHPAIKDRQNAVRARIKAANSECSLFVNPLKARWCDKGLATVQIKPGSSFQEDQKNDYQHITTAIGYCVEYEWPIKMEKIIKDHTPLPSKHFFNQLGN